MDLIGRVNRTTLNYQAVAGLSGEALEIASRTTACPSTASAWAAAPRRIFTSESTPTGRSAAPSSRVAATRVSDSGVRSRMASRWQTGALAIVVALASVSFLAAGRRREGLRRVIS